VQAHSFHTAALTAFQAKSGHIPTGGVLASGTHIGMVTGIADEFEECIPSAAETIRDWETSGVPVKPHGQLIPRRDFWHPARLAVDLAHKLLLAKGAGPFTCIVRFRE
jgi:hypothetical protein